MTLETITGRRAASQTLPDYWSPAPTKNITHPNIKSVDRSLWDIARGYARYPEAACMSLRKGYDAYWTNAGEYRVFQVTTGEVIKTYQVHKLHTDYKARAVHLR